MEAAIHREEPDRIPFDFWAVPEVCQKLQQLFDGDQELVLQWLGIDCRLVSPDYSGPELKKFEDGTYLSEWGSHQRKVRNEFSTYDDVTQMWRKYIPPRHLRLNAAIKEYGLKIMYHSCGAIYPLIGAWIDDMGFDVFNPLQPRTAGMDMQRIKDEFGGRIAFHGGIDLQETMSRSSAEDFNQEVIERCRIRGEGGGYICTTAHYIQADVALENILALYSTRRKSA